MKITKFASWSSRFYIGAVMSSETSKSYSRDVKQVLWVILFLNLAVVVAKGVAGWLAGSLMVIGDALHSTTDMINNVVGIFLMRYASAPPDKEHPYGHAKFETLGAFTIAGFLFATCFEIVTRALGNLFSKESKTPEITSFTVGAMVITIIVNLIVASYEARRGRELKSELLIADAAHTRSDVYVSLSVLGSFFFIWRGYGRIDGLIALGIAIIIAYNAYLLFRQTVPILVDAAMLDSSRIEEIALSVPGVHSCIKIRSRGKPGDLFIEMEITVDAAKLTDAHAITEKIEQALRREFGRAAITIHFEPQKADKSK